MNSLNLDSFMTLRAKLVQPRSIKTTRKLCTIGVNSTAELKTDDNFKKTKSTSVHAHNNSKSSTTTKLPSLYSNNLKYFLKESTVKKMKKRDYNYNRQDPSYIIKGLPNGTINHIIKNCSYGNPNEKRKLLTKYLNQNKFQGYDNNLNGTKLIDFTEILDLNDER